MIEVHDGSPSIGDLGRLLSMPRTRVTIGTGIISVTGVTQGRCERIEDPSNRAAGGNSRPTLVWRYLTAWLSDRTSTRCGAWAEALETVSPDRVTRLLPADWSGQTRLALAVRTLCVSARGALSLDDTVLRKPLATARESRAGVSSSQERQPGSGFARVLLVWTKGPCRVPLGLRVWPQGGPSKYVLALERRRDARHRLRCRPASVLFDAWYPAKALRKRLGDEGWDVVWRRQQNRRFQGQPRRAVRRHP